MSQAPRNPLLLLVVGGAAIALLAATDTLRQRSGVDDARQLQALEEITGAVAISHLWLEEHVSGDEVEITEIDDRLAHALALVDSMLGSVGENPAAPMLHTRALRADAAVLRRSLETFRTISDERRQGYARGLPVGIGSPLDVEYDREFETLLTQTAGLQVDLERHHDQHQAATHRWLVVIVGAWTVLLLTAVLLLWRRDRQRREAEESLAESRRQLMQTQKMEVAGRMAGGLAHDLANYLAAIRGHAEWVMLKHPEPAKLERKMRSVLRTVDSATELLDRLLAFARRRPVRDEPIDLGALADEIEAMVESALGDDVTLEVECDPDLWPIRGDLAQIEQALVNLVLNARDAMPSGGIVRLSLHNRHELGERVEIRVADEGMGIAPEHLEHIFEPFWTTKRGGGSGLGLAVVYGVVQQHGGELEVASELGGGTVFTWSVPRAA